MVTVNLSCNFNVLDKMDKIFLDCDQNVLPCTLSCAFSVARAVSWWMPPSAEQSAGRSHTFTVQSWLPVATNDAFILGTSTKTRADAHTVISPFILYLCCHVCKENQLIRQLAGGVLPGAGDGAHSVGVAGALGHTSHLTTVTVHMPHTHWPVLQMQYTNVTADLIKGG